MSDPCREYAIDTVYFGGGTPTLLPIGEFEKLFTALKESFTIEKDAEITVECNPATADRQYFCALKALSANRLSIGLQSVNENELSALGRVHSFADFMTAFSDARAAGFDNISVDLMYGIPEQTKESFSYSIDRVLELCPEHISSYGLKIEENTVFAKIKDRLTLPDEDEEFELYMLLTDKLAENGYHKYEISNFSREGRASRHNTRYWLGEEYLGFGVAAHSFFDGERFGNSRDIKSFIEGKDITEERKELFIHELEEEYVMLRLRLACGIDKAEFKERFGKDFEETYPYVRLMIDEGFMQDKNGKVSFTDKGFFVSNYILSEMLDFE
jgi:oxygen-independent coproporphyrinogen-3 oxidase